MNLCDRREVPTFGGGECRWDVGIGVSAGVVLRGWRCKTAGLLDVFPLMRLPTSLLKDVSHDTLLET